ncbi:DUF2851 family protein, partial [Xanthovirga aplysinae]|uniref:DUF2851 family protein n=1 Tax=Xanthovirga aplysinae TaxID=2529853 RepID=UPI0012BC9B83
LFKTVTSYQHLLKYLKTTPSTYWKHHHFFGKSSKRALSGLGDKSLFNMVINTVVPLLAAYGLYQDNTIYMERAVQFLEQIPPEENKITRLWKELGFKSRSAYDSQAQIQLYNKMCTKNNCLSCTIGTALMKSSEVLKTT